MTTHRGDPNVPELSEEYASHVSAMVARQRVREESARLGVTPEPSEYNSETSASPVRSERTSSHDLVTALGYTLCNVKGCPWPGVHTGPNAIHNDLVRLHDRYLAYLDPAPVRRTPNAEYARARQDLVEVAEAVHRANLAHRRVLSDQSKAQLAAVDILLASLVDEATDNLTRLQGQQP